MDVAPENAELRAELADLRARLDRQREFMARLVHEFRSPLNAIAGFAEIMADGRFGPLGNPRYVDYAKDIRAAAMQLAEMAGDALDAAKYGSGRYTLDESRCDLVEVLRQAASAMRGLALRKRQDLALDLPDRLSLYADARALRQVAINLLSNAIKFTPASGLIAVRAGTDGAGALEFAVRDSGLGMSREEIGRAREPFKGSSDGLWGERGSGLGLPIVRALVDLHGGTVAIASERGEGTEVRVALPAWRSHGKPPPVHPWEDAA
jgi:two-component system, cell cycle sensor histidine kinase PleC